VLVPATYHSGDREACGAITKRGSGDLRATLCEAEIDLQRVARKEVDVRLLPPLALDRVADKHAAEHV
jgi:hypothetical protein